VIFIARELCFEQLWAWGRCKGVGQVRRPAGRSRGIRNCRCSRY